MISASRHSLASSTLCFLSTFTATAPLPASSALNTYSSAIVSGSSSAAWHSVALSVSMTLALAPRCGPLGVEDLDKDSQIVTQQYRFMSMDFSVTHSFVPPQRAAHRA